jgi:head-tail adaptor
MAAIGAMRERVRFEARGYVDDGMGNLQSGDFAEVYSCAARITPKLGGETVQAARLTGTQPMLITVRMCAVLKGIAADWRVVDVRKKLAYDIKAISNPDEMRKFIEILAVSGLAT